MIACVRVRGQELDVANEMSQAELHQHVAVAHVLAIGAEVIAAEHAVEFRAQDFEQNVGTARRRNLEEREEWGAEAPGPEGFAVVFVTGFVDVELRLCGQQLEQQLVGDLEAVGDLGAELGQLPATDGQSDHVAQELADGRERAVAAAFEKGDQGGQTRPDQAGAANGLVDGGIMRFAAAAAPAGHAAMFRDLGGFDDDFDLLDNVRRLGAGFDRPATVGATGPAVLEAFVDLVDFEGRPLVAWMSGLPAPFAFALALGTRRFDDVAGGRLGGIARVLLCLGQLRLQVGDLGPELGNFLLQSLTPATNRRP